MSEENRPHEAHDEIVGGSLPETNTRMRGSLDDEYEIYRSSVEEMGVEPMTFDEWLGA
ncbi:MULTISPECIES: hypothetical protein [unclassified Thioalkalivibrio]|uniref:hypothetical protein n=1 Tax=unclassified Thioalkalivibrio TaxID=2621013 RepID=UPI00039B471E|nr:MULTISPECIES: hypothetical protein [unclassified Thioalkalivibrio]